MALGLPNLCCSVKGGHLHHPLGVAAWGLGAPPAFAGLPPHLQKVQGGLWGTTCWDWGRARPGQAPHPREGRVSGNMGGQPGGSHRQGPQPPGGCVSQEERLSLSLSLSG